MAVGSAARDWISKQTSMEKLAIGLVWLTLPDVTSVYGAFKLGVTAILTGWIFYQQLKHKKEMTNFDP